MLNNLTLPDVSRTEIPPGLIALEWVGMQGIELPVLLVEPGYHRVVHAHADALVDLPDVHVKGIHMSRLYRLLDDALGEANSLTPSALCGLLQAMVDSHGDCASRGARVRLAFDLLTRRPALVSQDLAGWKSYPVRVDASCRDGRFALQVEVTVTYSSTCPCSAALSRQLVERAFMTEFADAQALAPDEVARWLRQHATVATPHSQRSHAQVSVEISPEASSLGMLELIDAIEAAVGTPVQTAVKRADEQAFASLNGRNLMFVEDAARRIQAALREGFVNPRTHVRHLESLHPHDAVALAGEWHEGAFA